MALKRTNQNNTTYTYARIKGISYSKMQVNNIQLEFIEKDSNTDEILSSKNFNMNFMQQGGVPFTSNLFIIEYLSQEGNNIIKSGYEYLKTQDIFRDFEDC